MTNQIFKIVICLLGIWLVGYTGQAQVEVPFAPRLDNSYINIKGDYTFLANPILNRVDDNNTANDPYNGTANNNGFHRDYIDVDNDPSTFSSSSSSLTLPDCSRIYWAGLYWSANYQQEVLNNSEIATLPANDTQRLDFTAIKFKVPGGNYVDLVADNDPDPVGEEDAIIHDDVNFKDSPYTCFKNVTNELQALADPQGEYTVANVRATRGRSVGGAGGWTLVIIYENPTLTGKYISVFDGYAGVSGSSSADINVSGFNTIPVGPVSARLGASVVEGDRSISGDAFRIETPLNPGFSNLSNAANPANNFFNSNITIDGVDVTTRDIYATNTLGYDADIFEISNPSNSVIANGETDATLRLYTQGDGFGAFLVTFGVEIIEPNIVLEKRVEDIAGNDITGAGVNLGQYLDYVLSFVNTGNDNAVNYTIRDVLPVNVTLDETSITMPAGTTYTYDPVTREVTFSVPNGLVEEGDPISEIRMRVQVAENCFDFVDACTDVIQNVAYSTYEGEINDNQISDDPSVSDFDDCGFTTPGATNFLLDDLSACNFERTVQLCGSNVVLDAGDNFDNYIWYRDINGNNTIDVGTDPVMSDGDPDGDPSTLLVTQTGTYLVDKQVADPCKDFSEIIVVELFGSVQSNPIAALINDTSNTIDGDIVVCPNDGTELPEIFLCGLNDTELVQVNIPDAQSIVWEQLDEASCAAAVEDCANTNSACTWNTVDTGNDFLASDSGQYRLVINYQNGCFSRFYFNIYKNPLDPQFTKRDLICDSDGNITVTNVPSSYEFQLVDQATGNIVAPYQTSPSFDIGTNGAYRVEIRQENVTDGCVFMLENIGILDRDFQVDVTPKDIDCTGLGELSISVLNVEAQYYYEISQGGTVVDTFGPSNDNNYTFENLNPGTYDVMITTDDNCDYTEQVVLEDVNDLDVTARVSQHITCREGNILMSSTGGQTPHVYAIWSFVDRNGITQISYPTVDDIPASEFQTSQIFDVVGAAGAGQYTYVVVDRNNCYSISNPVDIEFRPAAEYNATSVTDVLCYGDSTGAIQFNLVDDNGYQLTYYLFDANGFDEENYDYLNAIATNTSGYFPGLTNGDYAVVINQRKGSASCDYYEYHTISAPNAAIAGTAVLVQDYTCLQNGIIEAQNVTGGTAPYEYSIDGVTFDGSPTFNNLTDGTYTITIRDDSGCIFVTNPITIDPLNPPTDIDFSATDPLCPTFLSDVTLNVTGGTPLYTYEIISPVGSTANNGNNNTFADLAPGTYIFRVTDSTGCTYDESFTLANVTPIAVTGQATQNITCINATDGEAEFTISGFGTSYDYTITGPSGYTDSGIAETSTTLTRNNLDDGVYTITVTDTVTNCTDSATLTINAPPAPLSLSITETPPSCDTDGAVTLSASGGWGSYTYSITYPVSGNTFTNTSGVFYNLDESGTYIVSVTDVAGCTVTDSFGMTMVTSPVASVGPTTDLCYDAATGATVVVGVSGGTAPYYYSINGGPLQSSATFTNLVPGTYTFTVTDANGCSDDIDAPVTIAPQLSAYLALTKDLDCTVSPEARLDLTVNGGYPPYTYEVNINGGGYSSYGGGFPYLTVADGTYQFRVTDAEGCVVETNVVTVNPIENPQAAAVVTEPNCNGDANGIVEINVDPNFGLAPYQISFDGGSFSAQTVYTGLAAGTYSYIVRDAKDCTFTDTVTLTEPDPFTANVTPIDVSCGPGGDILGRIEVDIPASSGGVAPFTYTLYDNMNNIVSVIGSNPIINTSSTSVVFDGLDFGDYYIRIVDAKGCEYYENPVRILASPFLSLTSNTIADCINGGTVEVTADSGSGNYTFDIFGPGTPPNSISAPVGTAVTATFTNLNAGQTYVFRAVDNATGCSSYQVIDVLNLSSIDVVATPTVTDVSCYGDTNGSITFQFEGYDASVTDIDYEIRENLTNTSLGAGYTGTVSGPNGPGPTPARTVNNIPPGDYVLFFQEVQSPFCTNTFSFSIREPLPVTLSLIDNNNGNCNEDANVTVLAGGGTGVFEYAFVQDGVTPVAGDYGPSNYAELDPSTNTEWDVYVLDSSGCTTTHLDITIADDPTPTILLAENQCAAGEGAFEITVTLDSAGISPYVVSLNGGAFVSTSITNVGDSYTFSNLSSGNYTITLRDSNGCTDVQAITIAPPVSLTALPTVMPSCATGDGEVTLTASGGSGSYEYELFDSSNNSVTGAPQPSNTFTGLNAGTYVAHVYDLALAGCTATANVELDLPTPVSFTVTPTNVTCAGDNNGTIYVTLGPGSDNPPYQYELIAVSGNAVNRALQNSPLFTNLPDGVYDVRVVSGRGCEDTQAATIVAPNPLTASATPTDFACSPSNTVNESTITVTPSGGTASYFYSFNGNGFTGNNTFDVTDNGTVQTINYVVRDANGCEYTNSIDVQPLNTFTVNIAQDVAITCANPESVTLTVTETVGGDTYTIELLPVGNPYGVSTGSTASTASFDLSIAGNYTFRATNDNTGCYVETTYNIAQYDIIDVDLAATAPAVCFDDAGELSITVSNYDFAYDYRVYRTDGTLITSGAGIASAGSLAVTHPDLTGGNYYVEVEATQSPFCSATSGTVTIVSPSSELEVVPQQVASVTCTNTMGEVLIAPTGGYAPYDVVLTNMDTSQVYTINDIYSYVFTGLSAGNYEVRVTDNRGCEIIDNTTLELIEPDPIVADIDAAPIDLDCYGDDSASVWVSSVSGGSGNYNYQLNIYENDTAGAAIIFTSGEQGSQFFNNLGAGTYSITVTDGWGCMDETPRITITEPIEVMSTLVQVSEMTCTNDAQIRLTASGGSGSYEYSSDDSTFIPMGGSSITLTVGAGEYQYFVRDIPGGCVAGISNQVTIDPVPELTLDIDETAAVINCMGESTATITAVATGGLGNYFYELFTDATLSNLVAGPQTSGTFNNLPSSTYYVRVTSEDCIEVSPVITIIDPAPLQVDREEFTNITCAGDENGTITVEVSGGTGEILYAISPNLDQFDTDNTFTDLTPGIYDVIAQDVNGCFLTFQFEITQPEPLEAEGVNIMHEVCYNSADGSFEVLISGGTAPYETALNSNLDADFVPDQILFENLAAGTHVVFIRDAQGCETNVFVEIEPGVNLNATVTPVYECTGNIPDNYLDIIFEDNTVEPDVMYALDSTDPADMQLTSDFTNMAPGDHYITIAHANGCLTTYDFTIEAFEPLTLVLENNNINQITAIAAGGVEPYTFYFNEYNNGTNNTFYINRTDTYTVTVIDQNGCEATAEIYMEFIDIEMPNFFTPDGDGLNDTWIPENIEGFPDVLIIIYDRYGRVVERMVRETAGWDGYYDSKPLPTGDYWYVVRLNGELDDREFVGHFTLYR